MLIITRIDEIFPSNKSPYSMPEIILLLQQMYSPNLSRSCIYRAHAELRESPATVALVAPLDADASELCYSEEAARRIARKAIHNRLPSEIPARKKWTKPQIREIETKVEPE